MINSQNSRIDWYFVSREVMCFAFDIDHFFSLICYTVLIKSLIKGMRPLIKCVPVVIKDLIVSKLAICLRWLMWLGRSQSHRSARWFCHCFTPSPYSTPLMKCQKGMIEVTIGLSTQTSFLSPINTIEVRVVVEITWSK